MLLRRAWVLIKDTVAGFVEDEAMTRGAAIACYTMFSLAPLLFVAVAIAGLAFGEEAVQGALAEQLRALVGREGAEAVQAMVRGAGWDSDDGGGSGLPAIVGAVVLLVTASGVFAEIQSALNVVWKAVPKALAVCPSHALTAHRPLGSIMRARMRAYPALSAWRRECNGSAGAEPRSLDEVPD